MVSAGSHVDVHLGSGEVRDVVEFGSFPLSAMSEFKKSLSPVPHDPRGTITGQRLDVSNSRLKTTP